MMGVSEPTLKATLWKPVKNHTDLLIQTLKETINFNVTSEACYVLRDVMLEFDENEICLLLLKLKDFKRY